MNTTDSEIVNVAKSSRMLARIDSYKISTVYRPDALLIPWVFSIHFSFSYLSKKNWHNFRWRVFHIFFFRSHPTEDAVISATVLNAKLQTQKKKSRKRKDSEDSADSDDGAEAIKHVSATKLRVHFFCFFFLSFFLFIRFVSFCVFRLLNEFYSLSSLAGV